MAVSYLFVLQAAAEHQRIDPVMVEKLHELNSAGLRNKYIHNVCSEASFFSKYLLY